VSAPSVLVVIPSYNHGAFIGDRVQSILQQTHEDFELHVIDDCSVDQTMDVLSGFSDVRMTVARRPANSGSPFTAWIDASETLSRSQFDYIWIAESDDRAESHFLERGVAALEKSPAAKLYYCHSWFIDDADLIIGHSINYLKRIFPGTDWNGSWEMSGHDFIRRCLIRGMAIPNMSSALIRADAFRSAVRSSFARYKLAADWVFAIHAAGTGDVIFDSWDGNCFRHHARTSRRETDLSRLLFEHMSATRTAFLSGAVDRATYSEQMRVWAGMYRRERVTVTDFVKWGWKISLSDLPACLFKLAGA
jgi:glycosyltransferase involved in cell wall biosynthesis